MGWWKVSEFSRGILSAVGLLGAAEGILPYGALDLVAGINAVMVGWSAVASTIGSWIGELLRIPAIPPEYVSAAAIGLAIGPAWAFSILKDEWGTHKGTLQNAAFAFRVVFAFVEVVFWALVFVSIKPHDPFFYGAMFILALNLLTTLRRLPGFRSGFLLVLGFLVGIEGVYLVSTDSVQAAFDGFVCKHQGDIAPRCQ